MNQLPPEQSETGETDWQAIRAQLETDEREREHDVLRQRAKQYAASKTDRQSSGMETDHRSFLIFRLGQELYGIEIGYVRAIRPLTALTWLPGVPPFYRGVVHLKGKIISVLDLRYFFELDQQEDYTPEYIVIENGPFEIALLASEVHGIESIPMNDVQSVDNLQYAFGVTSEQITLLNLSSLFDDERLLVGESED